MNTLEKKHLIVTAAIEYHNRYGNFTVKRLCQKTNVSTTEFYRLFNSKKLVLPEFYPLCILRYGEMTGLIDDYRSMTLDEKLGNFIYTTFDLFQEQREFVDDTFVEMVMHSGSNSIFYQESLAVFAGILESDPRIPDLQRTILLNNQMYCFLTGEYLSLLKFWLGDESPNCERSMALTDKLVSFTDEVFHCNVIGKGTDLLKFILQNNIIRLELNPLNWFLGR